ncbi:MAG TPA: hypothetical protein VL551_35780 [Actinospica sp.]|nr:hypothetical protein [Actinospica sp.]
MTESGGRPAPGRPEPDEDFEAQFARLVKDVEEGRKAAAEEPSARARMLAAKWRDQPPPSTPWRGDVPTFGDATAEQQRTERARGRGARRVWPRNLAIAVIIGALTVGVVQTMRERKPQAAGTATPTAAATGAASAAASPATSSAASAAASSAAVAQIPVSELFPDTVHGSNGTVYTLVTAGALNSCVNSDMVAPTLAGLFAQSNGCVGGEGALYKDAAKDQFNMTVFTLKDPTDVISIVSDLAMDPTDFEVGALRPPPNSGLTTLSATSGIIQQFAGSGHYLGVFMAQWSDGRVADYGSLQKLLNPLQDTVSATMNRTH